MDKNKAIRLLAASWLIAPTILSTQAAFATETQTTTTNSSLISENNSTETTVSSTDTQVSSTTSTTDSTTESSTSTDSTTNETEESTAPSTDETAVHTLTIGSSLRGKIKLTIITSDSSEVKQVTIPADGKIEGLKEGTKIAYQILPLVKEKLISFEVNGAQEVNYSEKFFVVGISDITLSAKFDSPNFPSDSSSNEGTTNSNGNSNDSSKPVKPDKPSTSDTGKNEATDTSSNQSKPSTSTSNDSVVSANTGNKKENDKAKDSDSLDDHSTNFVTKTPIETTLPTNATTVQKAIVKEAYKHLGKTYVWGAKGPTTFDCSGLTYYVYMKATGHYIGGWTGEQQYAGTQIPISQAQPGDLVFWGPSSGVTHHVGIYIGNGQYIHAPQPGDKVRITSIKDYTPDFAVRVNIAGLPATTGSLMNSSLLDDLNNTFHFSKNQTTDQFLKKIADSAQAIGQKEGIYASVMMAQAILESGSGNSLLASEPNYNLFGIKGDYKGKSVSFNTLEQDNRGETFQIRATFRKYPSYKESLEDYARLIKNGLTHNKDFYKPIWKTEAKSYKEATKYLEGRYATDKQYSQKLNSIIETYNLTKYDEPKKETKAIKEKLTIKTSSKSLVVPVTWNKNEMSLVDLDTTSLKKAVKKPEFLLTMKIPNFWELYQHLSAKKIPKTSVIQVKTETVPLLKVLAVYDTFWLKYKMN
ncbi:glucosaminidase domain-containing protein [Enterococcus ratti]|uniref:glucosaminidase domain-containing protein n=1 Tax=Enterococcus ratti TaxID=150033 RepID=UPI003512A1DF